MPIFEYQCQACGGVQEVMQKRDDPAPADCTACHSGPLAKMLSRTAFILKGNGWYVTDFRGGKKPSESEGSSGSGGTSGGGDEGKAKSDGAAPAAAAPASSPATSGSSDGGSTPKASSTPAAST